MKQEILLLGNPVLRTKCRPVKNFNSRQLRSVITDLRDTLYDFRKRNGFGRGIAAPQIGITRQIIFIHINEPIAIINPRIIKRSKRLCSLWDDCFSFPNLTVKVKRHYSIEVRYQDEMGEKKTLQASGALSELLQHEIDHLNGVLAIDRAINSTHIILRSEFELHRDFSPQRHKGTRSLTKNK
ncbi:MAG: peptide deformylase [Bacteroidetes bacterium]|nr:peptide deformylase [Bacteroidota bacterium]MCW5896498.1 peptide deformylase [Bacteroidota bacterium]